MDTVTRDSLYGSLGGCCAGFLSLGRTLQLKQQVEGRGAWGAGERLAGKHRDRAATAGPCWVQTCGDNSPQNVLQVSLNLPVL